MNTLAKNKVNILSASLAETFGDDMNLARIKFFSLFILALIKVQSVCFEKLSCAFDTEAKRESSLRRIQRFFSEYFFDSDLAAKFIFRLLQHEPPYCLVLDRTNWKFGKTDINILVLAIAYKGVAFPLLHLMMPKFGSSSTKERKDLIKRYIRLFGKDNIECLLADREFIGSSWLSFLNKHDIRYHIRIREGFWVGIPKNGRVAKASAFFTDLKFNEYAYYPGKVFVNDQYCWLSASKIKNKQGKPELQIIVSYSRPTLANDFYKERWQIETTFRALKSSGFNIEQTHLNDINRIDKLFTLVSVAFAWIYIVGIELDEQKPIKTKKHGRMAKSLFKYGLEFMACILYSNDIKLFSICCKFLSCT
jgi:hypothetical protein